MFVSTDIEINEDEMAEAVTSSRYFTEAVESVVQDMDLQQPVEQAIDAMGVPNEDRVDDIAREAARDEIRDAEFMAEDDVDDLVRSILRDEGLLRESQVNLQAQARIEALEAQVAQLQTVLRDIAHVINPQPVVTGEPLEKPATFSGIY